MRGYIVKRILVALPTILCVVTLVFFILHILPGDPASIMLGFAATEERAQALRQELGLNDPLPVQYVRYLTNLTRGDLGRSLSKMMPVTRLIRDQLPATAELAVAGLVFASVLGIVIGIMSATRMGTWADSGGMVFALAGVSVPSFWLGLTLIMVFSVKLGWFPITGTGGLARLVLPVCALGFEVTGVVTRLVRSSMLEVLRQDYVRTARSKGLNERVVLYKHALKNAMIPVVTVLGLQFGRLLGGSVIIENVFGREGVGRLLVDAILAQDIPLVQGCVMLIAIVYALVNLTVDLSYAMFDPRVTYR